MNFACKYMDQHVATQSTIHDFRSSTLVMKNVRSDLASALKFYYIGNECMSWKPLTLIPISPVVDMTM